jgi:hypothetical protein
LDRDTDLAVINNFSGATGINHAFDKFQYLTDLDVNGMVLLRLIFKYSVCRSEMDSSASGKYLEAYKSEHYNDIHLRRALSHGVRFLMNGFAKMNVQIQRDIIQTQAVF